MVKFYCIDNSLGPQNRRKLKLFIERLFKLEGRMLNKLTYVFCDDDYLLEINNKFLKHNYYTDIITFDLSEEKDKIIGEVYISSERVLENSKIVEVSFQEELHRVIFHGVLHLVGYKDKSVKEAREIRRKEGFYLGKYFK